MSAQPKSFGRVALSGGAFAGAAQVVKVAVQFGSVIVLSRLLTPDDFGLVAALSPLLAFVSMFQDLGLRQALYQRAEVTPLFLNQMFYLIVALGTLCGAAVALLSPAVAWFYGDARLGAACLVSSLSILLGSWSSMPAGLLNREMAFASLAKVDIAASVVNFGVAVTLAWMGAGYWALVLAGVANASIMLALSAWYAGWKPGAIPSPLIDRAAITFGANLTGVSLLNYGARNADNILIGKLLGSVPLGYYERAYKLLLFPLQTFSAPLSRLMIPILSRLQDDPERFRRAFLRATNQLALVTVIGTAAVVPVSEELVALLFGAAWLPVAPIFAWLGVAGFVQPLNNASGWVFIARGRTDVALRWGIYSSTMAVASFVVGIQWGTTGVACAYTSMIYLFMLLPMYYVIASVGPVSVRDLLELQLPLLVSAGATWVLVTFGLKRALGVGGLPLMAASLLTSVVVTLLVLSLRAQGRAVLAETAALLRQGWQRAAQRAA